MIIGTNVPALGAHRSLKSVGSKKDKAANRLSTGLKINSAADDAAGLAISEKMRAQIRGLDRADLNTQDGISLIQTAEGGMSEVSNMLQRVRELSVQAGNDTNTFEDRKKIQNEIDQLMEEIDGIAGRTEFNNKVLLDGKLSSVTTSPIMNEIMEYLKGTWINDALEKIYQQTGLSFGNDINLSVEFSYSTSSYVAYMQSSSNNKDYTLVINTRYLNDTMSCANNNNSGPVVGGIFLDRIITHEMMHAVQYNSSFNSNAPGWFTEGLAEAVNGASDSRFGDFTDPATQSYAQSLMTNFSLSTSGSEAYSAGYLAVMYMDHLSSPGGGMISTLMANIESLGDFDAAVSLTYGMTSAQIVSQINSAAANITQFLSDCGINTSANPGMSYSLLGINGSDEAIIPNGGTGVPIDPSNQDVLSLSYGAYNFDITIDWATQSDSGSLVFQVGANAGQIKNVTIPSMKLTELFPQRVNVLNFYLAEESIGKVDNAISYVSDARAMLGAYQNCLSHTLNNLGVSSENMSVAKSRIEDADTAKEMMEFSKNNVLQQAASAMLSQANQSPNSVLQLLGAQ